jgi:hypothetical protein
VLFELGDKLAAELPAEAGPDLAGVVQLAALVLAAGRSLRDAEISAGEHCNELLAN